MDCIGITGGILAGGQNRRFPALKAFIEIDGAPIIERNLAVMRRLFQSVMISSNTPEKYFYLGAPIIGDVLASLGPMSGIYSLLLNTEDNAVFVSACDMPYINGDVIAFICSKYKSISAADAVDAVIPVMNNEPQPLFGVYCKSMMPYLEACIAADKTSLKKLLYDTKVFFVDEAEVRSIDKKGASFLNINTPEDYNTMLGHS
jgi:molybdopterin-guanine dinucleotide biosynthesis protein A